MKQRQADDSATIDAVVSDWWDDELSGNGRWADELIEHRDSVHEKARLFELIGNRVRGEEQPTRDLLAAINARLDELPADELPGSGKVVSMEIARAKRRQRVLQGAVAASLFAAVAAVGLSITTSDRGSTPGEVPAQASGPTENDRAVMASLKANNDVPEEVSPVAGGAQDDATTLAASNGGSSRSSAESKLPAWATGGGSSDSDPYVITHYRAASSEFGTVMPEVRAAAFERE
ncbi:MAG: hypothetical protein ACOC8M_02745 [Guyparkeria sp.]|uniref:hypothetical protein n=1 Tax=Guyparkeria sp. TaxID=2035736 RepID=UPI00397E3E1B